jgi:hypothetical protein
VGHTVLTRVFLNGTSDFFVKMQIRVEGTGIFIRLAEILFPNTSFSHITIAFASLSPDVFETIKQQKYFTNLQCSHGSRCTYTVVALKLRWCNM